MRRLACLLLVLALLGCDGSPGGGPRGPGGGKGDDLGDLETPAHTPKRIIWLIGDGMGVGQITSAAYASSEPLAILSMPELGVMATHEHEFVTTDSAASATAMASGHRTHYEGVGVIPGTTKADESDEARRSFTIVDQAQQLGWRTGLVATTSIVDATPAAFAAHRANRHEKEGIAEDLRHSGVDVLLGGGFHYFDDRSDGQNLVDQLRRDGYSVATTRLGLSRVAGKSSKVVALLADKDMPVVAERSMPEAELFQQAVRVLERDNPDGGFFLMVEGSWIDRESHVLDGAGTVAEMRDFDGAVAAALDYARGRDDTLVVVNADHETGGLSVLDAAQAQPLIEAVGGAAAANQATDFPNGGGAPAVAPLPLGDGSGDMLPVYGNLSVASRPSFSGPSFVFKATHSPTLIPVFAEGPGARFVTAARDNAELGLRMRALVAADGKNEPEPATPQPAAPENLIVVVTDGGGLAAEAALQYGRGRPVALELPAVGLLSTRGGSGLVPGRAGAAAALWRSGADPLLAAAEGAGRRTALVTSAVLDDPALVDLWGGGSIAGFGDGLGAGDGVDVVFAGGGDEVDAATESAWSDRGAAIERSWSRTAGDTSRPLVRLVAAGPLAPAGERLAPGTPQPSLEEMTEIALDNLEAGGTPFVLVVYAGGSGDAEAALGHGPEILDELEDWDGAVKAAAAFAAASGDTAVVVTSLRDSTLSIIDNHYGFEKGECGAAARCGGEETLVDLPVAIDGIPGASGFRDTALQGDFAPPTIILQYAWLPQAAGAPAPASANFVPLYATGPGSRQLVGFADLAGVGATLSSWAAAGSR